MKRLLFITPLFVTVSVAGSLLLPAPLQSAFRFWSVVVSLALSGLACAMAGFGFESGQRLRQAWLAYGASCFLDAFLLATPVTAASSSFAVGLHAALTVVDNVTAVISIWMFGRAYREAGLEESASRWHRVASRLAALVVGCAVAGPNLTRFLPAIFAGDTTLIVPAISSIGDIVILVCLVPIFFAAVRLRGGLLAWPWSFLLLSGMAWLLRDAEVAFIDSWIDTWLVCAAGLTISAALAQLCILSRAEPPA